MSSIQTARLNKQQVVEVYSRTAFIYDLWGILTESKARRRALQLAAIQDGESVLEVAVGTGLTFGEILRRNPHGQNFGVDLTPAMLAQARRRAARHAQANYTLSVGDAYALEFPAAQFDLLVNNYMFDLLPEADFQRLLDEFKRLLKPGGRLLLINMTLAESGLGRIWEKIYRLNPSWIGGCRGVRLAPALEKAGFHSIRREALSQLSFPSEVIIARR